MTKHIRHLPNIFPPDHTLVVIRLKGWPSLEMLGCCQHDGSWWGYKETGSLAKLPFPVMDWRSLTKAESGRDLNGTWHVKDTETTKHPGHVEGWSGSLEELAIAVGKMRYNKVAEFIGLLRNDIRNQSENDQKKERYLLAANLVAVAIGLTSVEEDLHRIWKLCEPHMRNEVSDDD